MQKSQLCCNTILPITIVVFLLGVGWGGVGEHFGLEMNIFPNTL